MNTSSVRLILNAASASAVVILKMCSPGMADEDDVGKRKFPSTLVIDDPGIANELSFPTLSRTVTSERARQTDVGFELSTRIHEKLAMLVTNRWIHLRPGGFGFDNFDTRLKYLTFVDPAREFILTTSFGVEWGGTGAARVGAERFSTITPQVNFGKGFGDLPAWLEMFRPVALTGQVGVGFPTRSKTYVADPAGSLPVPQIERHATMLNWGFTVQYSLPYYDAYVRSLSDAPLLRKLVPIIEASFATPLANASIDQKTTGTVSPGVIYVDRGWSFGLEALIPINAMSGRRVGFVAQLHFELDNIRMPASRQERVAQDLD